MALGKPKSLSNFLWPPVVIRTHLQFFIIGSVLWFERCNQLLILAERYLQISTEIAVFEDVVVTCNVYCQCC